MLNAVLYLIISGISDCDCHYDENNEDNYICFSCMIIGNNIKNNNIIQIKKEKKDTENMDSQPTRSHIMISIQ